MDVCFGLLLVLYAYDLFKLNASSAMATITLLLIDYFIPRISIFLRLVDPWNDSKNWTSLFDLMQQLIKDIPLSLLATQVLSLSICFCCWGVSLKLLSYLAWYFDSWSESMSRRVLNLLSSEYVDPSITNHSFSLTILPSAPVVFECLTCFW